VFGTNPINKKAGGSGLELAVQSIFPTVQGEGPFAGMPAVFLRMAGCNLRCYFCDTDFESKRQIMHRDQIVDGVVALSRAGKIQQTRLVVITGGEPMLQNLVPLIQKLTNPLHGFEVQIETAGTVWVDGLDKFINFGQVTLVCSPKTGSVHL
jgi:7-carboxy-7-deazaguanine synthase